MGIQIKKVEINSSGPISSFRQEMAPLTLVYARNERGKTTIVENIIASLFRNRKGGLVPTLRQSLLGPSRVTLQGITDKQEHFSPGKNKKKLDDLIESAGLSPSLFNLLVVKGAELEILGQKGAFGRGDLKELFSRQQIYDSVQNNIPSEVGYTELREGLLVPQRRTGRYKTYEETEKQLKHLETVAETFYKTLSGSELTGLLTRKSLLEKRAAQQQTAKRHTAFELRARIDKIKHELLNLKSADLEGMLERIKEFLRVKEQLAGLEEKTKIFQEIEENLHWLENARERYEYCQRRSTNPAQRISMLAAAALFLGTLGAYFLFPSLLPLGLLLSLCALVLVLLFSFAFKNVKTPASAEAELDEIRKSFEIRFGVILRTAADFAVQKSELDRKLGKAQALETDRNAQASRLQMLHQSIKNGLPLFGFQDIEETRWGQALQELGSRAGELEISCNRYEERLEGLGVDESDFIEQDPGIQYSREEQRRTEEELADIERKIRAVQQKSEEILESLIEHIGREAARSQSIGAVAFAIEDKRREYKKRIFNLLGEMIAGHVVNSVLKQFRKQEDEQLEAALNDPRICGLVKRFTGRYDRIAFQDERLTIGNAEESYNLSEMSSGAREQILLALRMGIALTLCGRRSLFLILDDAFQHSDWQRRTELVQQAVDVVGGGWQVIYFTMDDDIRERFLEASKKLKGGTFKLIEL